METVKEQPIISSSIDEVKTHLIEEISTDVADSKVCHKPNGVDCAPGNETETEQATDKIIEETLSTESSLENCGNFSNIKPITEDKEIKNGNSTDKDYQKTIIKTHNENTDSGNSEEPDVSESHLNEENVVPSEVVSTEVITKDIDADVQIVLSATETIDSPSKPQDENEYSLKTCSIEELPINEENSRENNLIVDSTQEISNAESTLINDGVHFETEVLVEKNDNDVNENVIETEYIITETVSASPNNILSELGENIELSEVLQSSGVTNGVENNNATARVEVFNKEELLEILEGNDGAQPHNIDLVAKAHENQVVASELESLKALKQLSILKSSRKQRSPRTSKIKPKENIKKIEISTKENVVNTADILENLENKSETIEGVQEKDNNIVNELVMDWEDDEQPDPGNDESKKEIVELDKTKLEDISTINNEPTGRSSVDSVNEDQPQKQMKSEDEGTPGATRRLGRVIKKKVIYDPDNPDTFTKTKTSKIKDIQPVKDLPPIKKSKIETPQQEKRKSRSPSSKLQWKKPSPRNSKQHKRLTEVDKLLMDEGAVNMIYQLTPEASKGRKNVKTKAEFIKKLQSSTPDGKEMKFRERKKDSKYEDGDARKLLGGKHRASLSSSVKSPAVSEDFETHSADDSIIYRRHSSSSYSSSCMSPRRLSDVESSSQSTKLQQISSQPKVVSNIDESQDLSHDNSFLSDSKSSAMPNIKSELINKEDCLSLKEKLNSKLSLALNKRKRENTKSDKPAKQKKVLKPQEKILNKNEISDDYQFVSIKTEQHLAEICFKKTCLKNSIEVFNELEQALKQIDENPDISVTFLSSQCGTLCSSLDLSLLLDENSEIRTKNAYELAESVRSLLTTVSGHSKLLCCGVWGACSGVWVALVALCDVALASECATFALAAAGAPATPGAAALAAPHRALPQTLVNDLVVFGRRISAAEALRGGLISRALWPDRFDEQVRNIVKDIAVQPLQAILLKKRLLSLKKTGEAEATFLSCLESERDLLVEYWTSVEGQDLLRTALDAA